MHADWPAKTPIGRITPYPEGVEVWATTAFLTALDTKTAREIAALLIKAAGEVDAQMRDRTVKHLAGVIREYRKSYGLRIDEAGIDALARHILDAGWART
jgi:hypothetical protein